MLLTHCSMCARVSELTGTSPKVTDLADSSAVSRVECVQVWRPDQTLHPFGEGDLPGVRIDVRTGEDEGGDVDEPALIGRSGGHARGRPAGSR
jgi:hypothetical protein